MPSALRNIDYTDRELLHMVDDLSDGEGWALTAEIAEQIGIPNPKENPHYAKHCVATRFSWMMRYGFLERDEDRTKWRVTEVGRELMSGRLTKSLEAALAKLRPGDRVLLTRELTRAYRTADDPARIMVRREWLHGTDKSRLNGNSGNRKRRKR